MKFAAIVFCICAYLYVSDSDYRIAVAAEEERITDVCNVRGTETKRDENGKLFCPKVSPTWAMAKGSKSFIDVD